MIRLISIFVAGAFFSCDHQATLPPPNILWITSEDNSPFMGCYGDSLATTPNLDRLASAGFLYTHAYANAPVCAPARNTIITGVYANSGGHQHMRSYYKKSEEVKLYPQFLREAGYYCTNNLKEDFNIAPVQAKEVWHARGKDAHYKNRPAGQPFFAIFNSNITHESSLHTSIPEETLRHKPEDVVLPPYHPDTPELRHDWAQYYDKIQDMDAWVGVLLKELERSGEAENTIVFYYGDHGGVLGRSKRFVYESGTHVPFIVHIPEKYKHLYPAEKPGDQVNRLISFVDLAPTLLSIIDRPIPDYMQGQAFLGEQKTEDPEYAFMFRGRMDERYDMSRAVRDHKYRYIRNYMPYREYGQYIEYLWRAPSMRSWEAAYKAGKCNETQSIFWKTKPVEELYDTEHDPWEVNNLATHPEYRDVLERLRKANRDWMLKIKDAGFIPEAMLSDLAGNMPAYDFMRSGQPDIEKIIDAAGSATASAPDLSDLVGLLQSNNAAIRYWGATGLLIFGDKAKPAIKELKKAARDTAPNVSIVAAEALYKLGEKDAGRQALLKALESPDSFARTHALNAIHCINENTKEMKEGVIRMVKSVGEMNRQHYDLRSAKELLSKWKVDPKEHGIEMNW